MNYIMVSPYFPPNYINFSIQLKKAGATVLGLGDDSYDNLQPALKDVLAEYYKVDDMHNYDAMLRGVAYFTHKYGKIDRIDSLNEYWLEMEARLRTDFNIYGTKTDSIDKMRKKSEMKEMFRKAGVPVARGKVLKNIDDALEFCKEVGYPVVGKPDCGVGAADTYKITSEVELRKMFDKIPDVDYIFEEYIEGDIFTYDGLTNAKGEVVYESALHYERGVMDVVLEDSDIYYYTLRTIPDDLAEAGKKIIDVFNLKENFFHLEFFRTTEGKIIALEANFRPPGGFTTDMMNYTAENDIYRQFAEVKVQGKEKLDYERKYYCCYIGRKRNISYAHNNDDIVNKYRDKIVIQDDLAGVFRNALGDRFYIIRTEDLKEMHTIIEFVHARS